VIEANAYDGYDEDVQELLAEVAYLRRIAGLNIVRATIISQDHDDEEVAQLLLREAAVMMSVCHRVESVFGHESE
jgi:hypothetical protein